MITHFTTLDSVTLEVKGTYYNGLSATHEDPAEPEAFEIEQVLINGVDVTELLEDRMEEIEVSIIENQYR